MTLKSDEVGERTPLLLSCHDISHMGLDISMRDGTVRLADYDHEPLEVARNINSGLLMMRIDKLYWPDYLREINRQSEHRERLVKQRGFRPEGGADSDGPEYETRFSEQTADRFKAYGSEAVSYTHLTLPTNREV